MWTICPAWGLDGERPMQPEILQCRQWADLPPPKPGRNFFGRLEKQENPTNQRVLAAPSRSIDDVSTRNDSATRRVETGKIRGMCSASVQGGAA